MASSKHWALYATKLRVGKRSEHQLAGARIGRFGVMLKWHLPGGWSAGVYWWRFSITMRWALADANPRLREFLLWVLKSDRAA